MYRLFAVRVRALERLTPHFVRVTFGSDDLARLGDGGPDQRIKLVFPLPGLGLTGFPEGEDWYQRWRLLPDDRRHPIRTYTIRRGDPSARELVVDFVAHGDTGPASRWVNGATVGDDLLIIAPDSSSTVSGGFEWRPGAAGTVLLAGDETAAPAICAIVERLPEDANGAVFVEVPTAADALSPAAPPGVTVTWIGRDGGSPGERLAPAVRSWARTWLGPVPVPAPDGAAPAAADGEVAVAVPAPDGVAPAAGSGGGAPVPADGVAPAAADEPDDDLWDVPDGPGDGGLYAWLAGEAGVITGLRRHLVGELGMDRSRVAFMGYWRLGRAES